MKELIAEITIQINDEEQFYKYIADYYDCEESEVDRNMIHEFLNDHIKAHNTVDGLFNVVGGDTDGWLIRRII